MTEVAETTSEETQGASETVSMKRWKKRVMELAETHGVFARFLPDDPPAGDPPPADPPSAPPSMFDGEGNFAENWMQTAGIDENMRGDLTLKATKSVKGLASQLVNAQKMIGKTGNMVTVPDEKSTEAEWNEFYSKTGRLETPDDYQITHVQEVGEIDNELEAAFKNYVHSKGLRPDVVQGLIDMDDQRMIAMRQAHEKAQENAMLEADEAFKKQWGAAYEERKALANRMLADNTDERTIDHIKNIIGNDVIVGDFLANIAKKFVEHKVISADVSQSTPVEALAQAEELRNTVGYITGELFKTSPATHNRITQEIAALMKKAHPEAG